MNIDTKKTEGSIRKNKKKMNSLITFSLFFKMSKKKYFCDLSF